MNRLSPTDSKLSLDAELPAGESAAMIAQSYHLYIERIDAAKNMARYYALSIQPTLFGDASLLRSWGRIGCRGQQMVHLFEDERHAVSLFLELAVQKRKRGYRPRTNCGNPGYLALHATAAHDTGRIGCSDSGINDDAEKSHDHYQ